ncbi:MAG: hypothetical protein ACREDE_05755 [Thermoplasmata archaeon]
MPFPFVAAFLALLLAYMVYSEWVRLDSRYLIAAALVLLVVTALVDAIGSTGLANTFAEFVFFLLGAGVVLLLVDHAREGLPVRDGPKPRSRLRSWKTEAAEPPDERQGPTDQSLERSE